MKKERERLEEIRGGEGRRGETRIGKERREGKGVENRLWRNRVLIILF